MILITRERLFTIKLRQAQASIKPTALRLSSRVLLFLGVPSEALDKNEINRFFGDAAVRSWPVASIDDLQQLVSDRVSKVESLEQAEVKLEKNVSKQVKKGELQLPDGSSNGIGPKLAKSSLRPRHREYHVIGPGHDTIDDLRQDIPGIESKIRKLREQQSSDLTDGSRAIFIEYKDQHSALDAYQPEPHHHSPLSMQEKFISVQPKEVLWNNLNIEPAQRVTNWYLATAFVIATTILWSIPVGIIGTWSNINYLTDKFHFLRFINNLPDPILGFLTGFVPPYLLSELVSYVPKFFRCEFNPARPCYLLTMLQMLPKSLANLRRSKQRSSHSVGILSSK